MSKSIKFQIITQLKYCQKIDFEADPNNNFKPWKKTCFCSISTSIDFPFITHLTYYQELDFQADPIIVN